MSGVYIKGMDLPDSPVLFCIHPDGQVFANHVGGWREYKALPVPDHGDLIDRDDLRASFRESIEECHKWADEVDKDTMMYARISQSLGTFVECSLRAKSAPAIIPADSEGNND